MLHVDSGNDLMRNKVRIAFKVAHIVQKVVFLSNKWYPFT